MRQDLFQQPGERWYETVLRLLAPSGGAYADGLRLAILNTITLIGALIVAGAGALVIAILRWAFPIPAPPGGVAVIVIIALVGLVLWTRFGRYHRLAGTYQEGSRDAFRMGLIGASPFVILAIMLAGSALVGLLLALVSLDPGRAVSGAIRLVYAMLLVGLAALNVFLTSRSARSR